MKKGLFFSLTLLVASFYLQANKCKDCLARPIEFTGFVRADFMQSIYSGDRSLNDFKIKKARKPSDYWEVYSDRSNNPVFNEPNGRTRERLGYMDVLYIVEVGENALWVRVARLTTEEGKNAYKSIGWINISNLLLTNQALLNDHGITKKGLIILNLNDRNELKAMNKDEDSKSHIANYQFYSDPQCSNKKREERQLAIRFVLKEIDGVKLLSVNDKIDGLSDRNRKNNVNGWIKNINITDWDTRICLETTHGSTFKNEYGNKVIPVFIEEVELQTFLRTENTQEAIYKLEILNQRQNMSMPRMPILENLDADVKKVATLGSVNASARTEQDIAEIKAQLEVLKTKRNKINILFVLDATSSMGKYFPAVQKGISNIIEVNRAKYKKSVKFGIAIYRDYEDGTEDFDVCPLTANVEKVYDFLAKVETKSVAKSVHESVFNGMIKGIKQSRMNPDESNIVVLIGDAGNYTDDPKGHTIEEVSELLTKFNASFVGFQVYYGKHRAYRHFNYDAMDLVYNLGKLSKRKYKLIPQVVNPEGKENTFELQFEDPDTKVLKSYYEGGFAKFTFANDSRAMPISALNQDLTYALETFLGSIDNEIQENQNMINKGFYSSTDYDNFQSASKERFVKYLKDAGFSDEKISSLEEVISRFSMSGYTKMTFYNRPIPCFVPVVFLSDKEVEQIISIFKQVDPRASRAVAAEQVYQALLASTMAALGESSDDQVKQKTLNEIWETLLNVPFDESGNYGDLGDIQLADLPNSNHRKLGDFIKDFQQSLGQFTKNNLKDDQFPLNDQYYYYVPLEKIPGNGG